MTFIGIRIGIPSTPSTGGGATMLRREANGTVTIVSLARAWAASLTRESDGTVTVKG